MFVREGGRERNNGRKREVRLMSCGKNNGYLKECEKGKKGSERYEEGGKKENELERARGSEKGGKTIR